MVFLCLNAADVGNYHAGYIGTTVGIPRYFQYAGAEFFEMKKNGDSWRFFPGTYLVPPFGDRKRDYYFNGKGMKDATKPASGNISRQVARYGPYY